MPPPLATIPGTWNDFAQRTEIHVLKRGVWENKGEAVGPRPLERAGARRPARACPPT